MTPQFGDPVIVHHLGASNVEVSVGTLAPMLDADGNLEGIVVESDGGASFIERGQVLKIEVDR